MAHGVHPAMKAMEPSGGEAALDRVLAKPQDHELPAGDDAVLTTRDRRDLPVCGA